MKVVKDAINHAEIIFDYWSSNYKNHPDYDMIDGNIVYIPENEIICSEEEIRKILESFTK